MLLLLACSPETGPAEFTASADDTHVPVEQDRASETTDVLVIGSGPAGLSAAIAASEAGAEVILLERESAAGGAGWFGNGLFAAGSQLQEDLGVEDSPAAALAEWADFTGGDGSDERVSSFVNGSAEVVDWLMGFGAVVQLNALDKAAGSAPRIHNLSYNGASLMDALLPLVEAHVRLGVEATELVTDEDGAVIGAGYALTDGSEEGWIAARAVVVATGGFARDVERVIADRPALAEVDWVAEAAWSTDGGGHDMLEEIGATIGNAGRQGVYVHSITDHRDPHGMEALWPTSILQGIIVDSAGERRYDESFGGNFELIEWMLSDPRSSLWLVVREERFRTQPVAIPAYSWSSLSTPEFLVGGKVQEAQEMAAYDSPAALAQGEGIDEAGLLATIAEYDEAAERGEDPLGKPPGALEPLDGHALLAVPLKAGTAKSFGGVQTTVFAEVIGRDEAVIAGLYAAGEVAGMLGTEAVGHGFSGSVGACYYYGRIAGAAAAEHSR